MKPRPQWWIAITGIFLGCHSGRAENSAVSPEMLRLLTSARTVFLGDSITYGGRYIEYLETVLRLKYPDRRIELLNLGLPSETLSGLSEPGHAGGQFPRPTGHERLDRVLERLHPELIVACYGMNDGIYYPLGEERFARYQSGIQLLRTKAAAAQAQVLHVTPPPFDSVPIHSQTLPEGRDEYRSPFVGYDSVLTRYSDWLMEQRTQSWQVIDIHTPLNQYLQAERGKDPKFQLAPDGVHLNNIGHSLIARTLCSALGLNEFADGPDMEASIARHPRGREVLDWVAHRQSILRDSWLNAVAHLRPGMARGMTLSEAERQAAQLDQRIRVAAAPLEAKHSEWNGYDRYDFVVNGKEGLVVAPKHSAPGNPWVWHGEFFGHKPAPDIALLGKGFHIVYLKVPDMLGCPDAVQEWNHWYDFLTTRLGLAKKVALVGLSRGGLYCYNWATANPDRVAAIYADAAVCDFKSWPGGKGKGKGSANDWKLVMERYHFRSEAEALAYTGNPVDRLEPLAKAGVPLLHVYGDADDVVPWEENTGLVAQRYRQLGGLITLIAKPGVGHHPHGLEDSTPIVEFILKHAHPSSP